MTDAAPVVELVRVVKTYEGGDTGLVPVLGGVDLSVRRGETLAIVGPSGSGKSTLLNIVGTLDRPTSGQVRIEGEDVLRLGERALSSMRNRKIGFVFQMHHLLPQCTVLENVLVPALAGGRVEPEAESRARRLIERVGLAHRMRHRPGLLSGGERQRVAVVRALINRPALVLADEPTGSLDRVGAENLCRLLADLNEEEGVTVIMVTHSMRSAAAMGRTVELRDGILAPARAGVAGDV